MTEPMADGTADCTRRLNIARAEKGKPAKGKLRILYECAPMAMVFENGESLLSFYIQSKDWWG